MRINRLNLSMMVGAVWTATSLSVTAQATLEKQVTVQPILVKSATNPLLSGNISYLQNFDAAADKIWKQAGINVVVRPPKTVLTDVWTNITTGFTSRNISALAMDFADAPWPSTTPVGNGVSYSEAVADLKTLLVWFVPTIGGGSTVAGVAMENGPGQTQNGIAIANSATTKEAIGALAHEIGHILGLSHTSALGDTSNLMEASSAIHTRLLSDIEPDGLRKYKLNSSQITTALQSPFLTSPPAEVIIPPDYNAGVVGLSVPALLAASDGSGGTQDQIGFLADVLASAPKGKPAGIQFQAYDFVTNAVPNVRSIADFDKATKLAKLTLPKMGRDAYLVMSVTLEESFLRTHKYYWCTFRPDLKAYYFWLQVEANDPTLASNWRANMATPFKQWSDELLAWANSAGYGGRLLIQVCPASSDAGGSVAAFSNLASWTASVGLNPSIKIVRSPWSRGSGDKFLYTIPEVSVLDLRPIFTTTGSIDYNFLTNFYSGGRRISNLFVATPQDSWETAKKFGLARQCSSYYWLPEFGDPRASTLPPNKRGPLTGLTDDLKSRLKALIANRDGY